MKYYKPLDGLRGVAVLLVMFRHWKLPFLNIELGWVGVNVFFVLSGFLISSIILKEKDIFDFKEFIKLFYIKRALRIFPIYFLYLLGLSLFLVVVTQYVDVYSFNKALLHLEHNWVLLCTYTYNNHHAIALLSEDHIPGTQFIGHLWSLAVEEQFYLVFPFIAFFLSTKRIKYLMIAILILSPILRLYFGEYLLDNGYNPQLTGLAIYKSTPFQLDSIATGVLLSTLKLKKMCLSNRKFLVIISTILIFLGTIVFLMKGYSVDIEYNTLTFQLTNKQIAYQTGTLLDYYYAVSFSIINIISALLIVASVRSLKSVRFLKNLFLVKLGKISYGVYLYHSGLYVLFSFCVFHVISKDMIRSQWWLEVVLFGLYFFLTYVMAYLSFRYVETPFLRLKKRISKSMHSKHYRNS